ncbi:MOSC and FAD-binding oxidoreductase domain-containing protein [Actinopolymorpha pittospori]|uniref:Ferredoxin-NADP reductase/MOSC domain-containing protein YiiM n=1 Tax=Actinopolymorpha pittospori TaxID=648752 RepID=A0A927MWK9_9ACTN|nr:MOSC and FAD-binding oxidoreductase domain-containing protein [Actinopolymorpha pittospori]MBE1604632.1 ferredoxin-NADP reductase/MOSC domain-containing protein YiiM [Actinopolymorpha pittospori]
MATLLSVNVGMPKNVRWQDRTVYTGIWKRPVTGPAMVRTLNVDGDGQGDLAGHGGEQRAVLVYQIEAYAHWADFLQRDDLRFGHFGENLTIDGLTDDKVCIGDRYRIGEAEFEVTQPRVTCYRVGMRLGEPRLPALLVSHRRPGFYMRVIREGRISAGDEIIRTAVGPHELSVADIDALLYLPDRDIDQLRAAVDIPALSPGWKQSFDDLLAAVDADLEPSPPRVGAEPGWDGFRPLRVTAIVAETPTITSIYFASPDGRPLPAPTAGQYLTVRVPAGGQVPSVRAYSLSSSPGLGSYRISVKREPHGSVSTWLHDQLRVGATVEAAKPRGDFVLAPDNRPVVLVSAGVGATPVLAMLHQLADERSTREVWWIQAARGRADHAFLAETRDLLAALPHARHHTYYTRARPDDGQETDTTYVRPTAHSLGELGLPRHAVAYLCGPDAFMAEMRDALSALGTAPEDIHTEVFGALASITPGIKGERPGTPHPPDGRPGTGPQVTFARSGLTVRARAGSESLLELAEACDVPTRWSCRTGVCHTCSTAVLSGGVGYDPEPLEPPREGEALICCSWAKGDIVLDL